MRQTIQQLLTEARSRIREIEPAQLRALQARGVPVVDQPIVQYCRSGGRSALAAEAPLRLGFREPLSLAGGFLAWSEPGGEVEVA